MDTVLDGANTFDLRGHTILVIDDKSVNLRMMADYLASFGVDVLVASDGENGIEKARNAQPDLILLDVLMPGWDGFETCQRLKADAATKNIPVIFMTAMVETEHKIKGFKVGAVDYIAKPFQHEETLARITTHLRLRELTERLEQKVHERTTELEILNRQLQQEITERIRAEETLRESEARYRSLFEGVPVGIYRAALDGKLLDANPALVHMLGYPDRATLLAETPADIYVSSEAQQQWQTRIAQEGIVRDFEAQLCRYDGTIIWVKNTGHIVRDAASQELYHEGSMEDITERKEIQQHLLHAEKLAVVGKLSASIIHEINNPLQALVNLLDLAQEEAAAGKDVQEFLQISYGEVLRLIRTANRVRGFCKLVSAEEYKATNVNYLIQQVLELTAKQCQHNSIEASADLAADLPMVKIVSDQIQQVFLNLVINAIDAMPEGGQLQVRTTYLPQTAEICAEFADTGSGIAPEVLPRIFEPFFTTKETGTGLGLDISKHIIEQHGGRIAVDTQQGAGTTFAIYVPLSGPEPSECHSSNGR